MCMRGVNRLFKAMQYSLNGLQTVWRKESSFRQECALLFLATVAAGWLDVSWTQRLLLMGSVLLVLVIEILNSAIETVVDRFGGHPHPLSAQAKDMGSAAVFLMLLLALVVWIAVLCERFWS